MNERKLQAIQIKNKKQQWLRLKRGLLSDYILSFHLEFVGCSLNDLSVFKIILQ